jgi:hypothetical protein
MQNQGAIKILRTYSLSVRLLRHALLASVDLAQIAPALDSRPGREGGACMLAAQSAGNSPSFFAVVHFAITFRL